MANRGLRPNLLADSKYVAGYVVTDLYDDDNNQPRYGPFASEEAANAFAGLIGDHEDAAIVEAIYQPAAMREHIENALAEDRKHRG